MTVRVRPVAALLLAAFGTAAQTVSPPPFEAAGPGPLETAPCRFAGIEAARCGTYRVYEDRQARRGRILTLSFVVLPASGPDASPDPVFLLAGGPGQAATGLAPAIESLLPGVRSRRDVVLVDQRGSGGSNGLECRFESTQEVLRSLALDLDADRLRLCRDTLDADLRLYTTPLAMDDVEELRRALGYGRINLYGGSYGTRAAQVFLRRHPDSVRTLILRGVTTTGSRLPLYFARDGQRALDRLLADCAETPACVRRYPNLEGRLHELLGRLDAAPARVRSREPSGEPVEVEITRASMVGGLRLLLYATQLSRAIPLIIDEGLHGRFDLFLETALPLERQILSSLSLGLFLSVVCAEDVPFIDLEEARLEARGSFIGDDPVRVVKQLCSEWPAGALPPGYADPVRSEAPVLLISGTDDPVTPPGWAEEVARHLPNSHHVVLPDTGHIPATPGCVGELMLRFLETPEAVPEAACVGALRRPPFLGM